jgi:hypothetical protein
VYPRSQRASLTCIAGDSLGERNVVCQCDIIKTLSFRIELLVTVTGDIHQTYNI